jgi:hypothetical protein
MAENKDLDLTRWNRAGLSRFDYLDANAATLLEELRAGLNEHFPGWDAAKASLPADEGEAQAKLRLEALYAADPDDMLWQLNRQFARACHVLAGHIDAYANEAYLGTATQWENVRRLVALLDYAPQPPASAYTSLVIHAKEGASGLLDKGFQVKNAPQDGSKPVIFETLEELELNSDLNLLRASGYGRNPQALSGRTLVLEGKVKRLKTGEPLVLEDERNGNIQAYLIQGVLEKEDRTIVTVTPSLSSDFVAGYTRVHAEPGEKLPPIGPQTTGAEIGRALQLTGSTGDLEVGEVVVVGSPGKKPYFQRLKRVQETRLVFEQPMGDLTIEHAIVSRPVEAPVAQHGKRETESGAVLSTVYLAGDWTRLAGEWVADQRKVGSAKQLPMYYVFHAKYVPVGATDLEEDDKEGYTALTLKWHKDEDRVEGDQDLSIKNAQTLLVPPASPGPWRADTFLQKSNAGHLANDLVTEQGKKTAAGDYAVLVQGSQMAWCELEQVDVDLDYEEFSLRAKGAWQDRGGGPFFLTRSRLHAHFKQAVHLLGWEQNDTPISGNQVPVNSLPDALGEERVLVIQTDGSAIKTKVKALYSGVLELEDDLPADATHGNLEINANVVSIGHGENRPQRVLGSGDTTRSHQSFVLEVEEVSFVPDATQSSGVRADLELKVAGQVWEQVANLKDSGPADDHFALRMTEDGYVRLLFGDGSHGRRLPTGTNNLRVGFRQGVGGAGNLDPGSLIKPVKPHRLLEGLEQPIASSGGAAMEDLTSLRTSAPATLLTLERAVSLEDFSLLARSHSSVWQARAFQLQPGRRQRERVEVVVALAEGTPLLPELQTNLVDFIHDHAVPGASVTVNAYEPVEVSFQVVVRLDYSAFDKELVQAEVKAALEENFSLKRRRLGQPLYRGELYKIVEGVTGVANSTCEIGLPAQSLLEQPKVVTGSDGIIRVIAPADRQCVHLSIKSPKISVFTEEFSL